MVFDMLKYTFSDSLFNTLYFNIKYKHYKNFLRDSTHHSFIFNF